MSLTLCLSHCVSHTMSHSHYDSHIMLICPSRYVSQYCTSHTMSHSHTTSLAHFVSFCTLRSIYQASYALTVLPYVSYTSARSLPHAYCVCPSNVVSWYMFDALIEEVVLICDRQKERMETVIQVLSSTHTTHQAHNHHHHSSISTYGTYRTAHCSLCTHQFYFPLDPTS